MRTAVLPRADAPSLLPPLAGALSLSAAIAHLGVAAPHFRDWWLHGMFFVVCGAAQALLAALVLWRPRAAWIALAGIAGNVAIVTMYVYSRTNGAPVGPHAGMPEEPGVLDFSTTVGELALIVVLIAMLGEVPRRWAIRLVMVVGVALWAGRATGVVL